MGRSPCCEKDGLNRGAWTAMEDKMLADYVTVYGEGEWKHLPKNAGLKRCGKSCRLRWLNYLRPGIKRGNFEEDEADLIVKLHKLLGNRWSLIAGRIPGRTDNDIKNYWNTNLSKKAASSSKISNPKSKAKNAGNRTVSASLSSKVFWTRAARCSKVILQPQLPQPPAATDNVLHHAETEAFLGNSMLNSNSDLRADEGIMATDLLNAEVDDDDLRVGDFCLSEFPDFGHDDQSHQLFSPFNDWMQDYDFQS